MAERARNRAACHDAIGGLLAGLFHCGSIKHVTMGKLCRRQLVLHLAEVGNILSLTASTSAREGDIPRRFGDAEIDRIDQWYSEEPDKVEDKMPFTLRAAQEDLRIRYEGTVDGNIVGPRAAHTECALSVENLYAISAQ
jgi:hypothetical protein